MAGIDANLDDLQSGVEACVRAADSLHNDATGFEEILKHIQNAPQIGALTKRAAELQACARDQQEALQDLREGIARLQEELKHSNDAVRPPRLSAADRSRR
jgi:predicted  nucleic acid-binding Zn-ribbon protein